MLLFARDFAIKHFDAKIIYGDTDSIFLTFPKYINSEMTNQEKLLKSIEVA